MNWQKSFSSRLSLFVLLIASGLMLGVAILLGLFSSSSIRQVSRNMASLRS